MKRGCLLLCLLLLMPNVLAEYSVNVSETQRKQIEDQLNVATIVHSIKEVTVDAGHVSTTAIGFKNDGTSAATYALTFEPDWGWLSSASAEMYMRQGDRQIEEIRVQPPADTKNGTYNFNIIITKGGGEIYKGPLAVTVVEQPRKINYWVLTLIGLFILAASYLWRKKGRKKINHRHFTSN